MLKNEKEKNEIRKRSGAAALGCLAFLLTVVPGTVRDAGATDSAVDMGKKVYKERCLVCHGEKGNGKGPASAMQRSEKNGRILKVSPRDFTTGVFRFRSTPTGCMPVDSDLIRLVDLGITRSFMPPHNDKLTEEEKKAVIGHLKSFAKRWTEEAPCEAIPVKKPGYVGSRSSVEKGLLVYKKMKCWECHGDDGAGGGPKADK